MYTFRVQNTPLNFTAPYEFNADTLIEGITKVRSYDGRTVVISVTEGDAVHHGTIDNHGVLVPYYVHASGWPKGFKRHCSKAYEAAQSAKVKAALA